MGEKKTSSGLKVIKVLGKVVQSDKSNLLVIKSGGTRHRYSKELCTVL